MRIPGLTLSLVAVMSFAIVGCGDTSKKDETKDSKKASSKKNHDDHDHKKDGHDHDDDHAGHGHPSKGPHHGSLIELGDHEYHAELLHDDATKAVTIYILDKSAKKEFAIAGDSVTLNLVVDKKPMQFKLATKLGEGDTEGKSSRFEIVDEKLVEALHGKTTSGRLNVTIKDKPYVGKIEHHNHEDHGHGDHDHKDGDHDHDNHDHKE